ncbi:MAG TPA: hypothetical protein VNM48_15080 [Chloroflexota bacterium]|nr:hypothetical protein [Chloroflexota bacterium]
MARTLSDTLIIAVIEAATRLTGARGPIAGAAPGGGQSGGAAATPAAGEGGGSTGATSTENAPAARGDGANGGSGGSSGGSSGGEHDSRSAEQIAADFRTIYTQVEELVKGSAEQETKAVGFGQVGPR